MATNDSADAARAGEGLVRRTWLGMTLVEATALIGMIVAYLGALGAVFKWFGNDYAAFRQQDPWLFWPLLLAPILLVLLFVVGPKLIGDYRRSRRERLALHLDPAAPLSGYFRLDPWVPDSPEKFTRADGAHEQIRRWVEGARRPVLFLSGASGSGKSSLLEGYVLPMLERQGWRVVPCRSFGTPLADLETALAKLRRGNKRTLVVFDQFEEFVILEGRAGSEEGRAFIARIRALQNEAPDNLVILFALRSDYLKAVIELELDELASGTSWREIAPFNREAARRFLAGSPLGPTVELTERLLDGAEAVEEVPGIFRPIVLNMLGLALDRLEQNALRRPECLIRDYLIDALQQPGIREISPRLVEPLVTAAGTKQPRRIEELADETKLGAAEVKLCLERLAARQLVRPLDEARRVWEVAHDFVAKQLAMAAARLRPPLWPILLRWLPATLVPVMLMLLVMGVPLFLENRTTTRLRNAGIAVVFSDDRLIARASPALTSAGLQEALPDIRRTGATGLELRGTQVTDLDPLHGLPGLQSLELGGTRVADLDPLRGLTGLQSLGLGGTQVADLDPLRGLTGLQSLELSGPRVADLDPLRGLTGLQRLELSGPRVADLDPLRGLTGLQTLYLSRTQVADLDPLRGLIVLKHLDLGGTPIADLGPLRGLIKLQSLGLGGTRVADLDPLRGLTALQWLSLSDTQVADLDPLRGLTGLQTLELGGTQVVKDDPALQALKARGVDVSGP